MPSDNSAKLSNILAAHRGQMVEHWLAVQAEKGALRRELIRESEVTEQCTELLRLVEHAIKAGPDLDVQKAPWSDVRELLKSLSQSRSRQGFTPNEVATFVLSMKHPLFEALRADLSDTPDELLSATLRLGDLIDAMALLTTDAYQQARDRIIARQQEEMLELSTPVVKLWDGILALPIIGTLDSGRAQVVMENLLQAIVDTSAEIAIIDITGVPTVDTLVSQHLLKTVAAARLMGAECYISGIRPQIAQTMVHLGVDLSDVVTKATLADAFALALRRQKELQVFNKASLA